jgi:hypothetical protein
MRNRKVSIPAADAIVLKHLRRAGVVSVRDLAKQVPRPMWIPWHVHLRRVGSAVFRLRGCGAVVRLGPMQYRAAG